MEPKFEKNDEPFEEILFELNSTMKDVPKELAAIYTPDTGSLNNSIVKKLPRFHNYLLGEEEDSQELHCFEQDALLFLFEKETSLKIKEARHSTDPLDLHLKRLETLSNKLGDFNALHQYKEPEGFWQRMHFKISSFCRSVKKIPKHLRITKLVVNLSDCKELGDDGLKFLIEFIRTFENLTYLEFEMKNTKATDYCVGLISSLVGSLKNLTYFYVDFSGCKITEESLFFLANALKTKVNIEQIWLRFSWCPHDVITNEALACLSKSLESCKKLKVLLLEFNGQTQISSKGLSEILGAVKEKKNLQRLYLYFEKSQVNDNFLNYSGKILPKLGKLQVFGLNLAHSSFVTIKGLENLRSGLKSSGSLKAGLYLYLSGCLGIIEKEKMKKSIDRLIAYKKVKNYMIEF